MQSVARHSGDNDEPPIQGVLLRARTTAPRTSPRTLHRTRLLRRLEAATDHRVTLVTGGPGSGKTLLVSSWASGTGSRPVAWLALDADCNDPQLLLTLLLSALDAGGQSSERLRALHPPADVDDVFLGLLLAGLTDLPPGVVLVLEDLHEVQSPAALAVLDQLITDASNPLHTVLLTRADPALRLHRLRVAEELAEIRQSDLAFTPEEADQLFVQHGLTLHPDQVEQLVARTEGWAAGLRMAALTLQDHDDPVGRGEAITRFTGDDHNVSDYLVAEVLERQSPELRQFLLETSVVERIRADLADTLTGLGNGAAALDELERSGAFVVSLDGHRGWYRYHRLFLEVCRHRLSLESPDREAVLHARAAHWFAAHGEPVEALRQAIAAQAWEQAGRIAVRDAGGLVLGHGGRPLRAMLRTIPADAAPTDPWVACARALACYDELDPGSLDIRIAETERLLPVASVRDRAILGTVLALLRSASARARYDVVAASWHSADALRLALGVARTEVPALPSYVGLAHVQRGKSLVWQGLLDDAQHHLRWSTHSGDEGLADPRDTVLARANLALVEAMLGSLTRARSEAKSALRLAAASGWGDLQSTGAHLALVVVNLQQGDHDACEEALAAAGRVLDRRPDVLIDTARRLAAVRLLSDDGDHEAATRELDAVARMLDDLPDVAFLAGWLRLVRAEADLAAGRSREVLEKLADVEELWGMPVPAALILRGWAHLAESRPQEAIDTVAPVLRSPNRGVTLVDALLVTSVAHEALRRDAAALEALDAALDAAEPEHLVRPFLRSVNRIRPLLGRHRTALGSHAGIVDRVLGADQGHSGGPLVHADLTDREISVVQLLPTMMSNVEIAAELHVSVNTVKAHLKTIYRKLEASGRRDAVIRWRQGTEAAPPPDGPAGP